MSKLPVRGAVLLGLVGLAAPAHAQVPPLRLEPVATAGPEPYVGVGGYALVVHDARNERVLLLSDTLIWAFDLSAEAWGTPQRLVLPPGVVEAGYDGARDALVLWNGGVGDVYAWRDGDSTVTRIDRSFPHRTQHGHAGLLHPGTGDVYAFGGYGFWYYRNLITRFDRRAREWFLAPLAEGSPQPRERTEALVTYWPAEDALFVLGGVAGEGPAGRQEPGRDVMRPQGDLWRYDHATARWRSLPLPASAPRLSRYYPSTEPLTASNTAAFSALDEAGGLWFVAGRGGEPQGRLYGVDLRRGAVGALGPLMSASEAPLGFVWDAPRGRLVVLQYTMAPHGGDRPVVVHTATIDPAVVRAALDEPGGPGYALFVVAALGMIAGVVWAGLWFRRRNSEREGGPDPPAVAPSAVPASYLSVAGEAEGEVVTQDGRPLAMSETERRLLALLAAARHAGAPFVSADRI